MKYLIFLILTFFPALTFASTLSKQEACAYPDGIHWDNIYVYWPGELPRVDGFLKKDGKLYYFIHIFSSGKTMDEYIQASNSPYAKDGFIRNKASYMVSFDCSRSKVRFLPYLRSTKGDQYGKFRWIDGDTLSYSISRYNAKESCKYADDILLDMKTMTRYQIEKSPRYPKAPDGYCLARGPYKNLGNGIVQFQVEKYKLSTKESWFSLYEYDLKKKLLSQIR